MNTAWPDIIWPLALDGFFFMMMREGGCCGGHCHTTQKQGHNDKQSVEHK